MGRATAATAAIGEMGVADSTAHAAKTAAARLDVTVTRGEVATSATVNDAPRQGVAVVMVTDDSRVMVVDAMASVVFHEMATGAIVVDVMVSVGSLETVNVATMVDVMVVSADFRVMVEAAMGAVGSHAMVLAAMAVDAKASVGSRAMAGAARAGAEMTTAGSRGIAADAMAASATLAVGIVANVGSPVMTGVAKAAGVMASVVSRETAAAATVVTGVSRETVGTTGTPNVVMGAVAMVPDAAAVMNAAAPVSVARSIGMLVAAETREAAGTVVAHLTDRIADRATTVAALTGRGPAKAEAVARRRAVADAGSIIAKRS